MTMQGQEGVDGGEGLYPERAGEPDCVYYMRTGLCGFGVTCRFNHPANRKLVRILGDVEWGVYGWDGGGEGDVCGVVEGGVGGGGIGWGGGGGAET